VKDDGGTNNGGVDTDPTPKSLTVNVTKNNQAPSGANNTVTTLENSPYTFSAADFGVTDPNDSPPNNLNAVKISDLPMFGSLKDSGVAVTGGPLSALATSIPQNWSLRRKPILVARVMTWSSSRCKTTVAPPTGAPTSIPRQSP
jgi:hypothetical protein